MYTCPMHPEIVSDVPGKCPKCGMSLVLKSEVNHNTVSTHHIIPDKGLGKITWKSYTPLGVIVILMFLVSIVISQRSSSTVILDFISNFMTMFFIVFGGFKLMDIKGFVEGYSTYDLLAQKWKGYGYIYPFIELLFGFTMLAGFQSLWLLLLEAIVMIFSGVGVAIKIAKKEEFMCACLGTFFKVPLTYVTLIEDFGMALLALILMFLM